MLVVERWEGGYTLQYLNWKIFVEYPWSQTGKWRWEAHREGTDASANHHGWCDREEEAMSEAVNKIASLG